MTVYDAYKVGSNCINLINGDLCQIVDSMGTSDEIKVRVMETNILGVKRFAPDTELFQNNWNKIDKNFLLDIGLNGTEAYILYQIIDSFLIKTDTNQSSSMILGEFFDVG